MSRERGNIESMIAARYNQSVSKKKNVSFNIDEELLERLDAVVSVFNENSGDTTRNSVIEEAVTAYVESAEDYFEKQAVINDEEVANVGYDTAIYPATNENFTKVFMGEHQWYYVRMAHWRIDSVKYVALYRGAPVSAITHFAEVIEISDVNSDNKRLIKLKEPIALKNPVKLGNIHVNNVRKLFYTSLTKLQNIETVEEIISI